MSDGNKLAEETLSLEFKEYWTHYRHMEETRMKYLAFHASITMVAGGFLMNFCRDVDAYSARLGVVLTIADAFLFMTSLFIFANVVRIGHVLSAYDAMLQAVRRHRYGVETPEAAITQLRPRLPLPPAGAIFSLQGSAELFSTLICLAVTAAQAALVLTMLACGAGPLELGLAIPALAVMAWLLVRARTGADQLHAARQALIAGEARPMAAE